MSLLASLKRLTRHSAVYGIGHILTRGVGFLLLPLYTNYLDPNGLGVAAIVFLYLAVMTILYTYGIDSAFLRYFILSDDAKERIRIFSTAFLSVLLTTILFSGLNYLFADWLAQKVVIANAAQFIEGLSQKSRVWQYFSQAPLYFRYSAGILFFDALAVLPFLILRAEEKSRMFALLKFLNAVVNLGLNILFVAVQRKGVQGIFLANLFSSGFTFFTVLPYILRHFRPAFAVSELRRLLAFGLPYIPSTLAVVLMDLVDRFILKAIKGYEILGVYHANYKLAMIMALFVAAFRFAWHPFFLSTSKEAHAKQVFAKVLTYFMTACVGVYLFISFFVQDLVHLRFGSVYLIGPEYWSGLSVVPIVMLAYIFYGAYLNFLIGVHLEKKTGYLPFITGLGLAVNIIGNLLLIPSLGMHGAAWATVASYIVMAASLYVVGQRLYRIEYEFGRLAKLALVTAGYMAALRWMQPGFGVRLALILLFPAALLLIGFFEKQEISAVKSILARLSSATG